MPFVSASIVVEAHQVAHLAEVQHRLRSVLQNELSGFLRRRAKPSDKKDLVLALAQILAGTALLSGLYFTWRTLQINREGQITDRFTRAIEQLGATRDDNSKNLELRLGGIYALERIARDSEEDRWPIMEVLTAYIRKHSPLAPQSPELRKPDPDILAILTVLRSLTSQFETIGELDLCKTHLRRANLREAHLNGAILRGANLQEANLHKAKLREATLWAVDLSEANLSEADLSGADLLGATFSEADLSGADLGGADLRGATFGEADLSGADLSGADLRHLKKVELDLPDRWEGDTSVVADLRDYHNRGSLQRTCLTQEKLEQANGNEETQLPPHLNPPAHWSL